MNSATCHSRPAGYAASAQRWPAPLPDRCATAGQSHRARLRQHPLGGPVRRGRRRRYHHPRPFNIAGIRVPPIAGGCARRSVQQKPGSRHLAVFDQRTDMPLRREHLAGLADQLGVKARQSSRARRRINLGLDRFVFLDDNPVECAAVRAACPEVTVLQLPSPSARIPAFLDHLSLDIRPRPPRHAKIANEVNGTGRTQDAKNCGPRRRLFGTFSMACNCASRLPNRQTSNWNASPN